MRWLNHSLPTGEVLVWTPVLTDLPQGEALGVSRQREWVICCSAGLLPVTPTSARNLLPLLMEDRQEFQRRLKESLSFRGLAPSLAISLVALLIECSLSPINAPVWAAQGLAWLRGEERGAHIRSFLTRIIFDPEQFPSSVRQHAYMLLKRGIKKALTDSESARK
jgi:hypothetical protein